MEETAPMGTGSCVLARRWGVGVLNTVTDRNKETKETIYTAVT